MLTYEEWRALAIIFMFISFRLSWALPHFVSSRKQARHWYSESAKKFKARLRER